MEVKMLMLLIIFLVAIAIIFAVLPGILKAGETGGPSMIDVLFGWIGG